MAQIEIPWYQATVRKGQYSTIDPIIVDIPDFDIPKPKPNTRTPRGRQPVLVPEPSPVTAPVPVTQPSPVPIANPVTSPIGGTIGAGVGVQIPNGVGGYVGGQIPTPLPIPGYREPSPTGNPLPTGNGLVSALNNGGREVSTQPNIYVDSKYVTLDQKQYQTLMDGLKAPEQKHLVFQIWDVVDLALTVAALVPAVNAVGAPLRGASAVLRALLSLKNIKTFTSFISNITKTFGKSATDALRKVVNRDNWEQFLKSVRSFDFLPDYLLKGAI